ncbi:MAG: hypothetical protein ACFCUV_00510 [Rivularia sp. (in: cyanobacteria)]
MYVKFVGAGICFVLSLFNVLGAMQRVPIKTSVGDSSRPAVAMMKSPGANLNWLSGGVFFAASISLIAWAIWEYNSNIDLGIDSTEVPITPLTPSMPETDSKKLNCDVAIGGMEPIQSQQYEGVKPEFQNLVPFRRPTADGSVPITPEQFKNALEDDVWSD